MPAAKLPLPQPAPVFHCLTNQDALPARYRFPDAEARRLQMNLFYADPGTPVGSELYGHEKGRYHSERLLHMEATAYVPESIENGHPEAEECSPQNALRHLPSTGFQVGR